MSYQSGIGVISGWSCNLTYSEIVIHIDGERIGSAVKGQERGDTARECGHTNNGFAKLINRNLFGDGEYKVQVFVKTTPAKIERLDEIGSATVRVTTFGEEYMREAGANPIPYSIEDFPSPGETTWLVWAESLRNFVVVRVN